MYFLYLILFVCLICKPHGHQETHASGEETCDIRNLNSSTTYDVSVTAVTEFDTSAPVEGTFETCKCL